MKDDYSKVFAMLRPVSAGYDNMAGFARIEVRSGRGTMSLNAQGFRRNPTENGERFVAVLISNDGAFAYECGELITGSRGQSSLLFDFDPSNIGGFSLADFTAAAVVSKKEGEAVPLIAGIFGQRGVSDWTAAVSSLRAASAVKASNAPIPKWPFNQPEQKPPDEALDEEETAPEVEDVFAVEDNFAPVEKPVRLCAADLVWQGYAFAMKQLFETYPVIEPFDDIDDMIFVKVNMPVKSAGADHYILGAHAKGDEVDVLCIGVPGMGGALPPPGLEGTAWKADGRGGGYWITWQDAYMGSPIRYKF